MLENVVATSWQRRKLTSAQLWFSTVLQRCDNINNDVVTLSQRRCVSWEYIKKGIASCNWANPTPPPRCFKLLTSSSLLKHDKMICCNQLILDSYRQKQLPEVFYKKGVLKNFSTFIGKHRCQSLFFKKLQAWDLQLYLYQKETLAQAFSSEFCEIF